MVPASWGIFLRVMLHSDDLQELHVFSSFCDVCFKVGICELFYGDYQRADRPVRDPCCVGCVLMSHLILSTHDVASGNQLKAPG